MGRIRRSPVRKLTRAVRGEFYRAFSRKSRPEGLSDLRAMFAGMTADECRAVIANIEARKRPPVDIECRCDFPALVSLTWGKTRRSRERFTVFLSEPNTSHVNYDSEGNRI